jgi:hypothetical protein
MRNLWWTLLSLSFSGPALAQSDDEEAEVYPLEFRGLWGPSLAACKSEFGEDLISIGRTRIQLYEADSKLLKITPVVSFTAPSGLDAKSVNAIVAERSELEVGIGKLRLTLSGGKLYPSRIDEVPEDDQWKSPHVKCPAS